MQGRTALAAGVALLPLFLPLAILAAVAGRITARLGPKPPMAVGLLTAAAGVSLLVVARPGSAYLMLLPALVLWGVGMALLTPAVVGGAIGAAPPQHAGLASGVNNTARQAGGAIGIAAYGALAGDPAQHEAFIRGLHIAGPATGALWVAATLVTLTLIPSRASTERAPAD